MTKTAKGKSPAKILQSKLEKLTFTDELVHKTAKGKIKYGDPCPECGLSWAHGNVPCNYPYPEAPPQDTQSKGKTPAEILESKLEKLLFVDNLSTDPPQDTQEAGWDLEGKVRKALEVKGYKMGWIPEHKEEIVLSILSLFLSEQKRWEADLRKRMDTLIQGEVMEHNGEKFVSVQNKEQRAYNQALSDVLALIDAGKGKK